MDSHQSVETASRLVISRTDRPIARVPLVIWENLVCMQGRGASGRASVAYMEVSTFGRAGWAYHSHSMWPTVCTFLSAQI